MGKIKGKMHNEITQETDRKMNRCPIDSHYVNSILGKSARYQHSFSRDLSILLMTGLMTIYREEGQLSHKTITRARGQSC